MKTVNLFRIRRSDQGTEGLWTAPGFVCRSLELPWRENKQNISCIPAGEYEVITRLSPRFGRVYWVQDVPNRSYILIHSGNYAGDKYKGYKTHVEGCIILGKKSGYLGNQVAVLNSRVALRQFMEHMQYEPFKLRIQEAF